jgi:hypothetical protein
MNEDLRIFGNSFFYILQADKYIYESLLDPTLGGAFIPLPDLLVDFIKKRTQLDDDMLSELPLILLLQIQLVDFLGKNCGNLPFPFVYAEKTVFGLVDFGIIVLALLVAN